MSLLRRSLSLGLALGILLPAAAGTAGEVETALVADLRQAFEADAGKVRLLIVFSPT